MRMIVLAVAVLLAACQTSGDSSDASTGDTSDASTCDTSAAAVMCCRTVCNGDQPVAATGCNAGVPVCPAGSVSRAACPARFCLGAEVVDAGR